MKGKIDWKRKGIGGITILCLIATLMLPFSASASIPKTYKMVGKIYAIDLKYNTVVVNVPLTEKKIFRVGGPLAPNAVLKKGNKEKPTLEDFKVGDKVVVEWEATPKGHLIHRLEAIK